MQVIKSRYYVRWKVFTLMGQDDKIVIPCAPPDGTGLAKPAAYSWKGPNGMTIVSNSDHYQVAVDSGDLEVRRPNVDVSGKYLCTAASSTSAASFVHNLVGKTVLQRSRSTGRRDASTKSRR